LRSRPRCDAKNLKVVLEEAIRYTATAGFALLVDVSVLWALVHYFSWWYLAAACCSYTVGLIVGYVLSIRIVFRHRRLKDSRLEFASFAAIGAVGLAINAAVMALLVTRLGANYLIAKCAAAACTFVWGFLVRRQLLFVPRSVD
jgi:putative flippase GtrA